MPKKKQKLDSILKEAVAFHGHLGPFLVIGLRMGLIGLREMKTSGSHFDLQAKAILKSTPPFSCAIDGIQVATHCTIGNGKLKLQDKPGVISAVFEAKNERQTTVTLKPTKYEELKKELPEDRQSYKNIQLAREIASTPEEDLFTIEKK